MIVSDMTVLKFCIFYFELLSTLTYSLKRYCPGSWPSVGAHVNNMGWIARGSDPVEGLFRVCGTSYGSRQCLFINGL